MILKEHFPHHNRMKKYCSGHMLMLGAQENDFGYDFGDLKDYKTLDPDGGSLAWDLNVPIPPEWIELWETVYNLGTIEHVWNVHQAFTNAALMVKKGGHYLHHSPCAGYEGHGIHITDPDSIIKFFKRNGFELKEHWFTDSFGVECLAPSRKCRMDIIFWAAFKKVTYSNEFTAPQQEYKNGAKQ